MRERKTAAVLLHLKLPGVAERIWGGGERGRDRVSSLSQTIPAHVSDCGLTFARKERRYVRIN